MHSIGTSKDTLFSPILILQMPYKLSPKSKTDILALRVIEGNQFFKVTNFNL